MILSAVGVLPNSIAQPSVQIQIKPVKKVVCNGTYPIGGLTLVPSTSAVTMVTESQKKSGLDVKLSVGTNEFHAKLLPPSMSSDVDRKSLVAPSWIVPYASKRKDANMAWSITTFHMSTKTNLGQS